MSVTQNDVEGLRNSIEELRKSITSLREYMHATDLQVTQLRENLQYINKEVESITRRLNRLNGYEKRTEKDSFVDRILMERLLWIAVGLGLYFLGGDPIPI